MSTDGMSRPLEAKSVANNTLNSLLLNCCKLISLSRCFKSECNDVQGMSSSFSIRLICMHSMQFLMKILHPPYAHQNYLLTLYVFSFFYLILYIRPQFCNPGLCCIPRSHTGFLYVTVFMKLHEPLD